MADNDNFALLPNAIIAAAAVLADQCHGASMDAGWYTHPPTGLDTREIMRNPKTPLEQLLSSALIAQKLCLSHSEISEAMEGARKGLMDDKIPHRKMIEVEIADAIIRLFDLGGALALDVPGAIAEKMSFNAVRPDHKLENRRAVGGKAF